MPPNDDAVQLELFPRERVDRPTKQGRRPVIVHIEGSWTFDGVREASRQLGISRGRLNEGLAASDMIVPGTDGRISIEDVFINEDGRYYKTGSVRNRKRRPNGSTEEEV